ncbi:MAG: SH3 domain-containing protein [Desulfovibrio sp.]|nr:SH3 domain-containing protein [Desulfovibrio sp.]
MRKPLLRLPVKKSTHFLCGTGIALCLFLSACAGRGSYDGPPCADVLNLPQDLRAYAEAAGGGSRLLSPEAQADAAARGTELFFKPWRHDKAPPYIRRMLLNNFGLKADRAYIDNTRPFPPETWKELEVVCNKPAFGHGAGPAVTLRHCDLRAMPTSLRFYLRPDLPGEGYPFDYFQQTSLPPGVPLYICNISTDGAWMLVESPLSAGWLPARDLARTDEAFMESWRSRPLLALVRDNVNVGGTRAHIGTLLPSAGRSGDGLSVRYPRRGFSGRAEAATALLPPGSAVTIPLPITADNVAGVGNEMMGQRYTWGGLDEGRDCSALTRDIFVPFGLYLPRHSAAQAKTGRVTPLTGAGGKEALIMREARPFRSLLFLPGHIALYLGTYEGKGIIFHNIWGLRTRDASGGCDNRAVIGRAVVTTLDPGRERPDLCAGKSLLERMEKIVTPAE